MHQARVYAWPGASQLTLQSEWDAPGVADSSSGLVAPRALVDAVNADKLCSCAEAAEYLSTGERFVRRLIAERRIAYVKVGKFVRIQRSELDRLIQSGRVDAR